MIRTKKQEAEDKAKQDLRLELNELNAKGEAFAPLALASSLCTTRYPIALARKLAKKFPGAEFTIVVKDAPKCRRRATRFAHLERGNLVIARCPVHFKNYEQFLRADKSVRIPKRKRSSSKSTTRRPEYLAWIAPICDMVCARVRGVC